MQRNLLPFFHPDFDFILEFHHHFGIVIGQVIIISWIDLHTLIIVVRPHLISLNYKDLSILGSVS